MSTTAELVCCADIDPEHDPEGAEDEAAILAAVERLKKLCSEILQQCRYSLIESGAVETLTRANSDLDALVREAIKQEIVSGLGHAYDEPALQMFRKQLDRLCPRQ